MIVLALLVLLAPAAVLLVQLWRRPEKQFTLYSAAGRWRDALPSARVLARRPASALTRGRRQMNLGTILARLEEWDDARSALEVALATQTGSGDEYASLTRYTLALLELRRENVEAARGHARAIEAGPEELRSRGRMLLAASLLVEGKADAARDLLASSREELARSKKPSDMATLAVLAAADRSSGAELGAIVRERMPVAQRRELAAQLPVLARVL